MTIKDRMYLRTAAGERALMSEDASVPNDYRRLLRFISGDTHSEVIRGSLHQFPDALLADWLAELEEAGYISSRPCADTTQRLDFTVFFQ